MQKFDISGMSCAACSASVQRVVSRLEGVESCDVNLITGNLFVKLIDSDTIPFKVHRDDVKLVSRTKKRHKDGKKDVEQ